MKSINVLILCYNQEKVIQRALDSILRQREYGLKRIVISDDCSQDKTWEVLSSYQRQFPDIIEMIHPAKNLGIYGNHEHLLQSRGTADLYIIMAGDDELAPGLFDALQSFCTTKSVNTDESVALFFDWERIHPDGSRDLFRQDLLEKGYLPYSLFIRHHLYQRGMAATAAVFDNFEDLVWDQGLNLTEYISDSRAIRCAKKSLYIPVVGNYYYCGIGVSMGLGKTKYFREEEVIKLRYFLQHFTTRLKDKFWLYACLFKTQYIIKPRLVLFFKAAICFLCGVERYDCKLSVVKTFFSPFLRRNK